MTDFVTITTLAQEANVDKTTVLRMARKFEKETGRTVIVKRRNGGAQSQCMLTREHADEVISWRNDFPTITTPSADVPTLIAEVVRALDALSAALRAA